MTSATTLAPIELLVHNLSHSDLVLGINTINRLNEKKASIVSRPKFSNFREISEQLLEYLEVAIDKVDLALDHLFSRSEKRYLTEFPTVAIGFDFREKILERKSSGDAKLNNYLTADLDKLRFRGEEKKLLAEGESQDAACYITEVYFPLLSILLYKWRKTMYESSNVLHYKSRHLVVLVSGRGKPMDEEGNDTDNSTKYTAKLMGRFIRYINDFNKMMEVTSHNVNSVTNGNANHFTMEVELVHSQTNLFRYDENIVFVKKELLPSINKHRDLLADCYGGKWKDNMRVTVSFADGSTARISAINQSMKYYRPAYMHFWILKTFWRLKQICEEDIEWHSYEEISTEPAVLPAEIDDALIKLTCQEMQAFRHDVTTAFLKNNNSNSWDLMNFWLRKTKKPVLAVLLVQKPNQPPKLYRGTNMEVSMPTGSLCAERNVIGSALADDVTLQRQDIKLIAVYSMNINSITNTTTVTVTTTTTAAVGDVLDLFTNSGEMYCTESAAAAAAATDTSVLSIIESPTLNAGHMNGALKSPGVSHNKRKIISMHSSNNNNMLVSQESVDDFTVAAANAVMKTTNVTVTTSSIDEHPSKVSRLSVSSSNDQQGSTMMLTRSSRKSKSIPFTSPVPTNTTATTATTNATTTSTTTAPVNTNQRMLKRSGSMGSSSALKKNVVPIMKTIHVDENDMNPLKPCGACNEWLKKIAEVNPRLQIITFTDADCNGVYLEYVNSF